MRGEEPPVDPAGANDLRYVHSLVYGGEFTLWWVGHDANRGTAISGWVGCGRGRRGPAP